LLHKNENDDMQDIFGDVFITRDQCDDSCPVVSFLHFVSPLFCWLLADIMEEDTSIELLKTADSTKFLLSKHLLNK
jgi:hypothetical protein